MPVTIRGTVVTQRRRCGKANCRCANEGLLYESVVLSYSEHSRTRVVMLPPDEVEAVRAATEHYRAAKKRLEEEANTGLALLISGSSRSSAGRCQTVSRPWASTSRRPAPLILAVSDQRQRRAQSMDNRSGDASAQVRIEGFVVLSQTEEAGELWVLVETTAAVVGCPSCGVRATGRGRSELQVRVLPAGGRPVRLVWRERRWICLDPDCLLRGDAGDRGLPHPPGGQGDLPARRRRRPLRRPRDEGHGRRVGNRNGVRPTPRRAPRGQLRPHRQARSICRDERTPR